MTKETVWGIDWIEFERGFGQRGDGTSFHLSKEGCEAFCSRMLKEHPGDSECFSRPSDSGVKRFEGAALAALLRRGGDVWLAGPSFKIEGGEVALFGLAKEAAEKALAEERALAEQKDLSEVASKPSAAQKSHRI